MAFRELILSAQKGKENAFETLFTMYRPLIMKESIVNGSFDEDLFQEQCEVFIKCVKCFR